MGDSITLQTSKKTDIKNEQHKNIFGLMNTLTAVSSLKFQYIGILERPDTLTSVYNCHGMTLASRRTWIYDPSDIEIILRDDNYIDIRYSHLMVGDIILYRDSNGDISHSGLIVGVPVIKEVNMFYEIKVLSKWGTLFEAIHDIYDCPYPLTNINFVRCKVK